MGGTSIISYIGNSIAYLLKCSYKSYIVYHNMLVIKTEKRGMKQKSITTM